MVLGAQGGWPELGTSGCRSIHPHELHPLLQTLIPGQKGMDAGEQGGTGQR